MTTTLAPPRTEPPREHPSAPPAARPPSVHPGAREQALVLSEVASVLLTVTAVIGLGRLFEDWSFLADVLLVSLLAHAAAIATRRLRLGPIASMITLAASGVLVMSWVLLPETLSYGLPTGETLDLARTQLSDAWAVFNDVVSPAPVVPGFVLTCALAAWAVATIADAAFLRLQTPVEGAVPATTLFVFASALGTGDHRVLLTALFLGSLLLYMLAHRTMKQASAAHALGVGWAASPVNALRRGTVVGSVAVLAAVVVGPALPGAHDRAVIPWRNSDRPGGGTRVTLSPLVDIKSRLVDQSTVEVFTVESNERAYWRLTALDVFNGQIWSSRGSYRRADGSLPDAVPEQATVDSVRQRFSVVGLASPWLPAAYRPEAVSVPTGEVRYDRESGSLLAEEETSDGLTYDVQSAIPRLDRADLEPVPAVAPADLAQRYTDLPADFPRRVAGLARAIVERAGSQYEKALSLQNWFRQNFTYSLDVNPGHGTTAIEHFLFNSMAGYCEQFAGSYAAMARAVGLPSRVAVGFTPGEQDSDGRFHVQGAHAHAWPEVYLDGFGWVAFEPTPGRGIPGARDYTGVDEAQADVANPGVATTIAPTPSSAPTASTAPLPPLEDLVPEGDTIDLGEADRWAWVEGVLIALAAVVAIVILWIASIATAAHVRRDRRRAAAASPAARVSVAWIETRETLEQAGVRTRRWETNDEFATRAAAITAIDARLLRGMAGIATAAQFSPEGVTDEALEHAVSGAAAVERAVRRAMGWRERARWLLDPRPLLPNASDRLVVRVVRAEGAS